MANDKKPREPTFEEKVEMMRSRVVMCQRGHGPAQMCLMPDGVQWVCDRCGGHAVVARAVLKKAEGQ